MMIRDLLRSNVGRARGKRLVIVSACIADDFPEILKEISTKEAYIVKTCPEAEHINLIGYKIASFISYSNVKEVTTISVEGSPHCIQLHYIVEDIRKHFLEFSVKHYVFNKKELIEIEPSVIKLSRHLGKLKKILERCK